MLLIRVREFFSGLVTFFFPLFVFSKGQIMQLKEQLIYRSIFPYSHHGVLLWEIYGIFFPSSTKVCFIVPKKYFNMSGDS